MARPNNALKHGRRSGGRSDPLYTCWLNLRARCDNPENKSFKDYGARGIFYTPRWVKFANFAADMGDRPAGSSIDRIDSNGPYYKENCRWATSAQQNTNRRNCVKYTFAGKTQTLPEWDRELGINRTTLQARLQRGWPVDMAFTKPV